MVPKISIFGSGRMGKLHFNTINKYLKNKLDVFGVYTEE